MTNRLASGLSALIGALIGAALMFIGTESRADRRIHDYILAHPELIPEAIKRLQAQDAATRIGQFRTALETPFAGAWAGSARGDVTMVVFTDYRCGYCRASVADVERLLSEDKALKVVWREIPILGPGSEVAAKAALNAATQGQYRAVHRSLFASGTSAIPPSDSPAILAEIRSNLQMARDLGITGTPSFVIGGQMIQGAVGHAALKAAIAKARAASRATKS